MRSETLLQVGGVALQTAGGPNQTRIALKCPGCGNDDPAKLQPVYPIGF